jgi:hypothetical protein
MQLLSCWYTELAIFRTSMFVFCVLCFAFSYIMIDGIHSITIVTVIRLTKDGLQVDCGCGVGAIA